MSIINTFDNFTEEVLKPGMIAKPIENFPEKVLVFFSAKFEPKLLDLVEAEQISHLHASGRSVPIYKGIYKGEEIAFYNSFLGGPAAGAFLEEVIVKGAKKVLFFGVCGVLDKEVASGSLLIPTSAYRDEGTSYHYMEPSDYIDIPTADKLAKIFESINVPYQKIKVWTTDAFYRETEKNIAARKTEGCAAVEMECASVMAIGQFRGIEVYQFIYGGDCLDENQWDARVLGKLPEDMRQRILTVALESVIRL